MEIRQAGDFGARNRQVVVTPELTILIRPFAIDAASHPDRPVVVACDAAQSSVRFVEGDTIAALARGETGSRVVMLFDEAVFHRLGTPFPRGEDADFHLPVELQSILRAMLDCDLSGEPGDLYCAAKAVELLCEATRLLRDGALLPLAAETVLSHADTQRILGARRLIEERWHERLTLESIAGQCGVNREKLRRGFRALFSCSVAEAISEQRLGQASRMLVATDLPVSSIGYRNGYQNNASFSRAFTRRFGVTPSDYRAGRIAA